MGENSTEAKNPSEEWSASRGLRDPLTDLPDRTVFSERLEQLLSLAERRGGEVAVLFVDLDDFRLVNYSLGRAAGDRLLVGASERIRSCLGSGDIAARLGGDEFAVLLGDTTREGAPRLAGRLEEALKQPFVLDGREVFVTASVGIALGGGPAPGHPMELLGNADLAMYQAKENGEARYEIFEEAMNDRVRRRFETTNDLRRAVGRGSSRSTTSPR